VREEEGVAGKLLRMGFLNKKRIILLFAFSTLDSLLKF
jgi:hypothetical protein